MVPPSVQGTISSYKNVRKNGTADVYYNLQYTHKGKNHSFAIPVDKVDDFKAAITAGKKSNRLEQFFAYLVRDLRQVDCAA